jgi:hypothetical protein
LQLEPEGGVALAITVEEGVHVDFVVVDAGVDFEVVVLVRVALGAFDVVVGVLVGALGVVLLAMLLAEEVEVLVEELLAGVVESLVEELVDELDASLAGALADVLLLLLAEASRFALLLVVALEEEAVVLPRVVEDRLIALLVALLLWTTAVLELEADLTDPAFAPERPLPPLLSPLPVAPVPDPGARGFASASSSSVPSFTYPIQPSAIGSLS